MRAYCAGDLALTQAICTNLRSGVGASRQNKSSRLALGTVQFGLPYGVANQSGQITGDEAAAILDCAWAAGLDTLDTAIGYGESERLLGEAGVGRWEVITKLSPVPNGIGDVTRWVRDEVRGSLNRLNIPRIGGLLLHRPHDLLAADGDMLYQALLALRDEGYVRRIGVSLYGPDDLEELWPRFQFDLVQMPLNIIDRRLAMSGWVTRLHRAGVEVHIRSIFLQGLLLMGHGDRPAYFDRWQPLWNDWHRWLDDQAVSPMQACLGFALSQPEIDRVIVGVDTLKQLQEILGSTEVPNGMPPPALISEDLDLVNPSRWNLS